jgi:hypothetical protein
MSPRYHRSFGKLSPLILISLLAGLPGTPLEAQDTTATAAGDTATRAPVRQDTQPPGQPGMRPDSLAPDSLRRDTSALRRDTSALRRDTSAARVPPPGAPAPDTAARAAPPAPVDSALAVACRESGGEPPDLLTVVFRASATAEEREAVAREVGGTLLEQSEHQAPGAWYLRAPGSGINPLVADRLILLPPVLEVGATRCPS